MPSEIENNVQKIEEKLIWIFILLPGFLSLFIINQFVDLKQLSEYQFTFYGIVLTIINLFLTIPIWWILRLKSQRQADRIFIIIILPVSIITGIFFGLAAEKDWFFVTLRSLPITDVTIRRSSSRPLVFLLSQNASGRLKKEGDARPELLRKTEAWTIIQLKSGKRYEGWPEGFELGDKPSEIYLSPACEWVKQDKKELLRPVRGPGIIIFERQMETITFIDREESGCFDYWFGCNNISE